MSKIKKFIEEIKENKEKKMLSFMMAFLFIAIIVSIIQMATKGEEEKFEIKVKQNYNLSAPYPVLENETTISNEWQKLEDIREKERELTLIEKEIKLIYGKPDLTQEDSIKLLSFYERIEYLKLN